MAEPTWGLLAKAQDNEQLIDEAIAAAIAAHETDPDAHTGAGESLETHKSQEVIDHPPYSVIDDKTKINKFEIKSSMESMDGWQVVADGYTHSLGFFLFGTSNVLNNEAYIQCNSDEQLGLAPDYTKNPIFEAVAIVLNGDAHESRIGIGAIDVGEGQGFKFTTTNIYAFWTDEDMEVHEIEISGVSPITLHKLRFEIDYNDEIRWYIDNILKATADISAAGNIPMANRIMMFWTKTLAAGKESAIAVYRVLFQQDL